MRICFVLLAVAFAVAPASPSLSAPPIDDMQIRIFIDHRDQWPLLRTLDLDIVYVDPSFVDIIGNPRQLDTIHQAGFKTETIHESVSEFYRSRLPEKDMGGYKTLDEIYAYLDGIIEDHPNIVSARQWPGSQSGRPSRVATSGR